MRHKRILDVFTIINHGRQQVGFNLDGVEKYFYLSPQQVKKNTEVDITEVEILIGSSIRPRFYKKGDKMFDGRICEVDDYIAKDFWITPSGSLTEMRQKNKDKLKQLKVISKVFTFNRNGEDIVGFDTNEQKATFITAHRLKGLTMLGIDEVHILEGSHIAPEYYNAGDEMSVGGTCRKSGVVLKTLNLRFSGSKDYMHKNFETNSASFSISSNGRGYHESSNAVGYAYNPLSGDDYSSDFISDVFGMEPGDDIPWGNID